jgi:hypothetical protein
VTIASRSRAKLDAALTRLAGNTRAVVLDTGDEAAVERFFTDEAPWDHVVVSAAQTRTGPVRTLSLADAKAAMESKFWSASSVLQGAINAALPRIVGRIKIKDDLLRRPRVGLHEQVDQKPFDGHGVVTDPVIARRLQRYARRDVHGGAARRQGQDHRRRRQWRPGRARLDRGCSNSIKGRIDLVVGAGGKNFDLPPDGRNRRLCIRGLQCNTRRDVL